VRLTRRAGVGTKAPALTVGSLIAVSAMLVVAAPAMGTADPLKGGTTTLKFSSLKVIKAKGGAVKTGKKSATLTITGGSLDPTNGTGPVENGGSLKLKKGDKKATLSKIVATFGSGLSAKLKGKTLKLATLTGGTVGRAGFGGTVTGAKAKLTKKGAKALNKAFDTNSFKKGKKLGSADTSTVPSKVAIKSGASVTTEAVVAPADVGACIAAQNCPYAVKVQLNALKITTSDGANLDLHGGLAPPTLTFTPQTGGDIAPDCSDGTLTGSQGKLTFDNTMIGGTDVLTQATPEDQFGNKAVSFDAASTLVGTPSNPAPLGRAPATTLDLSGATCNADPASHKITITNVVQRVGLAASSIANQTFGLTDQGTCTGPYPAECPLKGGDLIGTTSWDITTQ
jgi:hypothetical protein